jgi:predicted RNase H-like nuclease (RuvC/YqgF family)
MVINKVRCNMSEVCKDCIYVQNLKENIREHKVMLDRHEDDIVELKADSREYKTEIKNLVKKMDDFITTIRWGLGIFVTVSIFVIGILLKK